MFQQLVLIFHILIAIALVALVLLQKGKGADMGAAFGSGASQTVFGSKGSLGFLVKITVTLAALFFVTSITLTYLSARRAKHSANKSVLSTITQISKLQKHFKQGSAHATLPAHAAVAKKTAEKKATEKTTIAKKTGAMQTHNTKFSATTHADSTVTSTKKMEPTKTLSKAAKHSEKSKATAHVSPAKKEAKKAHTTVTHKTNTAS